MYVCGCFYMGGVCCNVCIMQHFWHNTTMIFPHAHPTPLFSTSPPPNPSPTPKTYRSFTGIPPPAPPGSTSTRKLSKLFTLLLLDNPAVGDPPRTLPPPLCTLLVCETPNGRVAARACQVRRRSVRLVHNSSMDFDAVVSTLRV